MRVRALQKIYYDKRDRFPGDTYDMDDREHGEAKILSVLGKIEIVGPSPPAPQQYQTAALVEEQMPDEPELPVLGKRVYRRRDMRAQK